jgi:EpsI family protein
MQDAEVTSQLRLAAVAVVLLVPGAYLNGWLTFGEAAPASLDFGVPARVGAWTAASEDRLDARSESILEPSAYVLRRYEASGRNPVYLYVAFYSDRAGSAKGAHDPEICYPSSGWDRVGAESLELPAFASSGGEAPASGRAASETFRAKLLDMRRGRAQELVLYWFQPAERWPGNEVLEELIYVFDAVAGRPQYAFVRLVGSVASEEELPRVRSDLESFASQLAWPVRSALRGTGAATSESARVGSEAAQAGS